MNTSWKKYHVTFYDLGAFIVKAQNEEQANDKATKKMYDFLTKRGIDPAVVEPEIAATEIVEAQ
jgi:hypothetical protein